MQPDAMTQPDRGFAHSFAGHKIVDILAGFDRLKKTL
jgi:hypothetical protein